MQTRLLPEIAQSPAGAAAERILRACVHCGFCNATCPTYRLTGDELDGPRGRIYLVKQMMEGSGSELTRHHLDRCLQCGSCETTCPSGVRYGQLLSYGQELVQRRIPRDLRTRTQRRLMVAVLTRPALVRLLVTAGRLLRSWLPEPVAKRVPQAFSRRKPLPRSTHARRVLQLEGCVHGALAPGIDDAAARVFNRVKISLQRTPGCCGALEYHLGDHAGAKRRMRANLDRWLPQLASRTEAEALISTASGCTAFLRNYGQMLADDPVYAGKAAEFSAQVKDPSELLSAEDASGLRSTSPRRVAFQAPCTLTHGLKKADTTSALLRDLGYELTPVADSHLCCGSAGTYSLLQPEMSEQLRATKLVNLQQSNPDLIASANIGCILHLQPCAEKPVQHWLEMVDEGMDKNDRD